MKTFLLVVGVMSAICGSVALARPPADVDGARLAQAATEPGNWFTGGRDADQTYHSPLALINDNNVSQLGFAWQYDLGSPRRGQEATPVVVDGVMYTSGTFGYVYALDAATGRELWRYDPKPDYRAARNPCCDLVNRGVALWKGRVYVAAVDGMLHAIDAKSGHKIWAVDTIADHHLPYSSTGAPIIAGDKVVIGNSGSDMGHDGVRGYVSAYDVRTGRFAWRFYTVPPTPGHRFEHPDLAQAAKTWDSKRPARSQGGGTAWDGFAYDAKLDIVYFGTANAAPYDLNEVGHGQFDALYTASILAVNAKTGQRVWHYQTTPHDEYDFDAVQKLVLADLPIGGQTRHVIMQASKNGFFYVIDRASGELLSADNYTYVNWAKGVDLKSGRPIVNEANNWHDKPSNIYPSWAGGHTWMPMSWNAKNRLMYIPVIDVPNIWVDLAHNGGRVKYVDGFFTVNGIMPDDAYDPEGSASLYGPMPSLESLKKERPGKMIRELLRAWDPVAQKVVWEHETGSGNRSYDGGVLSTDGNLVFQGRGSGELWVYAADTGKVLKVIKTGSHIMAAPTTYTVNGEQYLAVQVGYGGAAISVGPFPASSATSHYENVNRVLAFKLNGGDVPTPPPAVVPPFVEPPTQTADAATIHHGEELFIQECSRCHQFGPSITPDLRKLNPGLHAMFRDILLKGAVAPTGMESFADILSSKEVDAIHAYLIDEGWKGWREQEAARSKAP